MKIHLGHKIKCLSVLLVIVGIFGAESKSEALPFLPAVYISTAGLAGTGKLTGNSISSKYFTDLTINNTPKATTKGFLIAAGIAPNIPLPFINGLRAEISYARTHNNNLKDSMIGIGLYYDALKFLPFINPYAGVAVYNYEADYDYHVSYKDESDNKQDEIQQGKGAQTLTSFSVGVNLNIPATPLQVFAGYRYSTSKWFSKHSDIEKAFPDKNYIRINHGDYSFSAGEIGIRYFIV